MSSDSSVPRPDNLNYKTVAMNNGRYRMRKVPINNMANATITLQGGATQLVEFKLPANTVWNPARSSIDYVLNIPAQGAGNFIWNFEDTFEICGAIQFCNASGVYLTDLQYANNYVSAAHKIDIDQEDFEGGDYTGVLYKATVPWVTSAAAPAAGSNYFPPRAVMPAINAYGMAGTAAAPAGCSALTTFEPQYARVGGDNSLVILSRSIPLGSITQTALGMDRDLIFCEDMYIRMQIAPSSKVAYLGTSATNPIAGAAVLANQPTISYMYLQLAMQVDPVVEASVRAKFLSGTMSYTIPYVYAWKNTTAAGVASVQLSLNNQYGNKLKRLLHVPIAAAESANVAYDHQNLNGAKILSYQTYIDSQPLQDAVLSCSQPTASSLGMDDWRENRPLLRASAIENSISYYYNWCHIDSFSQPKRGKVLLPDSNILEGLDLSMPRQWTITATTAVPLSQYTFGTFVREVRATPQGTQVVVV